MACRSPACVYPDSRFDLAVVLGLDLGAISLVRTWSKALVLGERDQLRVVEDVLLGLPQHCDLHDDKDVGKVKEIMLDIHSGRIAYVVLSSGGFLGMGDKLLAIPWHVLTVDTQQKCFRLSIPSEKIKDAPGFDKDNWPAMADHTWASSVHAYYGIEPNGGHDIAGGGYCLPGATGNPDAGRNL